MCQSLLIKKLLLTSDLLEKHNLLDLRRNYSVSPHATIISEFMIVISVVIFILILNIFYLVFIYINCMCNK